MKKHEFEAAAITLGGKKIGTIIVSAELADDLKFNPNLLEEPELPSDDDGDGFLRNGFQE